MIPKKAVETDQIQIQSLVFQNPLSTLNIEPPARWYGKPQKYMCHGQKWL